MLKALGAPPPPEGSNEPSAAEKFLGANPAAMRFVQAPKPTPSSFTRETYYAVNAFHFINSAGAKTAFRYRIVPTAGESHMPSSALAFKSPDFLYEELVSALPATFKLVAQMAGEGDVVDDATVLWGEGREVVELGEVRVEGVVEGEGERRIIFDPVPRVEGVEGSGDPLLELRAGVYLIGGRERREA